jgi:transcriptional regulator with XRE-family HTH domain
MHSAMPLEHPPVPGAHRKRPSKPENRGPEFPRVANALRAVRKRHGLTQEDMAPVLGLSFAGYRPYERGERDLTQSQIEMIATTLGVPVSSITGLLWPEDAQIVQARFSHDWDDLQKQVAALDVPDEIREQILRSWRESVGIMQATANLARRN